MIGLLLLRGQHPAREVLPSVRVVEETPDAPDADLLLEMQPDVLEADPYRTDMSGERTFDRLYAAAHPAVSATPAAAAFVLQPDRVGLCLQLSALSRAFWRAVAADEELAACSSSITSSRSSTAARSTTSTTSIVVSPRVHNVAHYGR